MGSLFVEEVVNKIISRSSPLADLKKYGKVTLIFCSHSDCLQCDVQKSYKRLENNLVHCCGGCSGKPLCKKHYEDGYVLRNGRYYCLDFCS